MNSTSLLVIGAGPYGLAVAAHAQARGVETMIVGNPMAFWRDHMPAEMLLRSGADWHLDASGEHTFVAFLEDRGIEARTLGAIPIGLYLEYADWFQVAKQLVVRQDMVTELATTDGRLDVRLETGQRVGAEAVVAAPGIARFACLPDWALEVPAERRSHTCDLVRFDELAAKRCVIVGGRQSAYEWAALLCEHGAERVDLIHRHDVPRFAAVDWSFVDPYLACTLRERGWWRNLPANVRSAIERRFWEVGRLTLEPWLPPRLDDARVNRWPGCQVTDVRVGAELTTVTLDNGEHLAADHLIFATGYCADLPKVDYLAGVIDQTDQRNGFPVLDPGFRTSLPGLFVTGFAATQDFGPFFGFVRGAVPAATIIVNELLR